MGDTDRMREDFALRTGITPDDMRHLGRVPLFAGFAPDDLRKLLATSSMRRYPINTTLFMGGEAADRFFVAIEGWVKLFRLCENGNEVVITVISPLESFAEAAVFDSSDYPVSAATVSDARLLVMSADSLMRALREHCDFTFNMMASMSRHLRRNISLLHQMSAMSTTERLAQFLLSLCDAFVDEAEITLPMDKSLIAARLGMQPETFSRALAKLKEVGVSSTGHDVLIQNVPALRDVIKNSPMDAG